MRALVGVALAGIVVLQSGCCTKIGCLPTASVDVATISDPNLLTNAKVDVWINDEVLRGDVSWPSPPPMVGYGVETTLQGAFYARVSFWPRSETELEIRAEFDGIDDTHDGDVYVVDLAAADGTTIVTKWWTATYETTHPNGRTCEPECVYAELTPR